MINYYDLYDGKKLVLENVTRKEIEKFLGMSVPGLTNYVTGKCKLKGRYLVKYNYSKKNVDPIYKEWADVVSLFKNVIWVKIGGRKLKIGG